MSIPGPDELLPEQTTDDIEPPAPTGAPYGAGLDEESSAGHRRFADPDLDWLMEQRPPHWDQ